jgi:hypothetical protein
MQLSDFNECIKIEYPEWANAYSPFFSGKFIRCNAVLDMDDGPRVIGIYRQTRVGTVIYLRLKGGEFLYGDGSGSFVTTNEVEFTNNIIKS